MSIIQTKFLKHEIYTNKVVSNDVNANEIYMKGYKLSDVLIGLDSVTHAVKNTKDMFGGEGTAVRYRAFEMNPKEYVGKYLSKIVLYNTTGLALQPTDLTYDKDGWLFVDCIRYIRDLEGNVTDEEVLDTFFSINGTRQAQNETETAWVFTPIYIKEEYDVFRFRGTNTKDVADRPTTSGNKNAFLTKRTVNRGGEGWNTYNQDSITPNTGNKAETASFGFELASITLGMGVHIANNDIHVTKLFKDEVETHIGNDIIHLTAEEKEKLNNINTTTSDALNAHINKEGLHWTSTDRVDKENFNKHIKDANVHMTNEDREHIKNLTNIDTSVIDSHMSNTDIHFSISKVSDDVAGTSAGIKKNSWDFSKDKDGNDVPTVGAQGIAWAEICPDHTLPEGTFLSKITVPQNHEKTDYDEADVHLVIYGKERGSNDWTYVTHSIETQHQKHNNPDMVFTFPEEPEIGKYNRYKFFYIKPEALVPGQNPPELTNNDLGNNWSSDSNRHVKMAFASRNVHSDCCVYQSSGGRVSNHTYPAIISYYTILPATILHKDNEAKHVTPEFKELIVNSMALINSLSDNISELSSYNNVSDLSFSTFGEGMVEDNSGAQSVKCIQLSKKHFVRDCLIKEILIPYINIFGNDRALNCFLCVQFFNSYELQNPIDTAIKSFFSTNIQTQLLNCSSTEYITFQFDDLIAPSDYKFVRFSMVKKPDNVTLELINLDSLIAATPSSLTDREFFRAKYVRNSSSDSWTSDTDGCKTYIVNAYGNLEWVNCRGYVKAKCEKSNMVSRINRANGMLYSEISELRRMIDELSASVCNS